MVRRLRVLLLFAPLAPAASCAAGPSEPDSTAAECPLTVSFGSYAMGIDRRALARVEALIAEAEGASIERSPRGREGEVALCVRTKSAAQAAELFERISDSLPADPRGPVTVATAAGRRFEAPAGR
jgi:hypothetical protein